MTYLQLILGLALLLGSGEFLVRGSVGFARAIGLSPLFIGLTLVGFGTSTPELVASLIAAFRDSPGIAVGNVVGSNIANIILILGVAALVAPMPVARQDFHRDATALGLSALVALAVVTFGSLTRPAGGAMVLMLVAYIVISYVTERTELNGEARRHEEETEMHSPPRDGAVRFLLVALAALVGVVTGARLLVDSSLVLAHQFGVPETVIGLTIVAVGTSLPEMAVSVIAAFRGHGAVAVGNIVGSNIYNVLGILGVTALVHPLSVPPEIAQLDIWVMLASTAALLYFMVGGRRIGRVAGVLFLVAYSGYLGWLFRS